MPSQLDLDQGGTSREWANVWMGPTLGWVWLPRRNVLSITAAGTYPLDPSTSLVEVNVAGAVTVILPTTIDPGVPAVVLPGRYAKTPVSIVDTGLHAAATPITIQPASGSENILGLASIQITSNGGGFILYPNATLKGWTNQT
jgi:hypothetical protein